MTSDPEGNPAETAPNPEENTLAAEAKPKAKARKKKVVEEAEASVPVAVSAAAAEEVKAKPAKKAATKKTKPTAEAEEAVAEPIAENSVPAKPKAAKKAAKKDKGRDLVVDEPGAQEIAEVLHTPSAAPAEKTESDVSADVKRPEPQLERLQKILARAGTASRRAAEEMILAGRVQINGKVVTELGTRADPAHDHVRVDGKLLQGPERTRYFVLNKPKGYVTTVSDPEGRPTVMHFFAGERERLYPVGRLDYLSEGLLLVTNDGELANKLTKASSGVEKTYLVKVAGQPTEEALDALRAGVVIERGRGIGSGRVRTAPAQIRQVRAGDNPWYEVIVIEGRNRELRKMFEEIGHHVEKIRRVGYGPLVLDLEPGKVRELEPEEVHSLRLASEGKLKTRRRRGPAPAQLPTVAGRTVRYKKADGRPGFEPRARAVTRPEFQTESKAEFKPEFGRIPKSAFKPKPSFKPEFKAEFRSEGGPGARPAFKSASKSAFKPGFKSGTKPGFAGRGNFAGKPRRAEPPVTDFVLPPRKTAPPADEFDSRPPKQRPDFNPDYKPGFRTSGKPPFRSEGRPATRPGGKPEFRKDRPAKSFGERGRDFDKTSRPARPRTDFARPAAQDEDDMPTRKTPGFRIEPIEDKPRGERPARPFQARPFSDRATKTFRPAAGRSTADRPDRPARPAGGDRPYAPRTERPAAGGRPFRPRTEGSGGASTRPPRRFADSEDRPREFRPRSGSGAPKKFAGSRPPRPEFRSESGRPASARPARSGPARSGPGRPGAGESSGFRPKGEGRSEAGGPPRKKERWRDSFTGKNKGRPKPKPKRGE